MNDDRRWRLPQRLTERLHLSPIQPDDASPRVRVRSVVLAQPQWKTVRALGSAIDRPDVAAP
jgi:hypothetical protein